MSRRGVAGRSESDNRVAIMGIVISIGRGTSLGAREAKRRGVFYVTHSTPWVAGSGPMAAADDNRECLCLGAAVPLSPHATSSLFFSFFFALARNGFSKVLSKPS